MKLLFKILSLKVINASFQIIQADAQKEVRAEILRANASGFIAILNWTVFVAYHFTVRFIIYLQQIIFKFFLLEHFFHFVDTVLASTRNGM